VVRRELPRHELSGRVVPAFREDTRRRAERRGPHRDVRCLAAGTGASPRAHVVAGSERLLEPHDHVEHHISESDEAHYYNRPMDGQDKRARVRSFVLGGLVGASAALATARRRRDVAKRRRERRLHPAGLAAFESAPCFQELLDEEQEAD
jgi:hypothetical protein